MTKTVEEIDALKENWAKDPIWDLEYTEGFEEHVAELRAFRKEQEEIWEVEREEKVKLSFEYRAGEILDEVDASLDHLDASDAWVIGKQQVKATLLMAEQVKRVADALEEIEGHSSLAESARIWGTGK